MLNGISHHHLTKAQPVPEQQLPTSFAHSLYTEHDTMQSGISLWIFGVGCPCPLPAPCAPQPHGGGVRNWNVFVSWCKPCLATTRTAVSYQQYSHPKSKTQLLGGKLNLSERNQDLIVLIWSSVVALEQPRAGVFFFSWFSDVCLYLVKVDWVIGNY